MEKAEFKKSSSVVDSIMIFDGVNAVKAGSAVSSNNNFINFFLSRIMRTAVCCVFALTQTFWRLKEADGKQLR